MEDEKLIVQDNDSDEEAIGAAHQEVVPENVPTPPPTSDPTVMAAAASDVMDDTSAMGAEAAGDQSTKKWHLEMTPAFRNLFVKKLMEALAPIPEIYLSNVSYVNSLARKIEGDLYDMANSRSEYCDQLTNTIYCLQKKFEAKGQEEQQQQPQLKDEQQRQPQHPALCSDFKLFFIVIALTVFYECVLAPLIF